MGFNKLSVVKRLRAQLAEDESQVAMFLREARLSARLNHANIVQTYEVGEQDGEYFIAMEYLEGQSLQAIMAAALKDAALLEIPVMVRIVSDALAGLHYSHELRDYDGKPLNIVHRDISPHNVFVTYAARSKLERRERAQRVN